MQGLQRKGLGKKEGKALGIGGHSHMGPDGGVDILSIGKDGMESEEIKVGCHLIVERST